MVVPGFPVPEISLVHAHCAGIARAENHPILRFYPEWMHMNVVSCPGRVTHIIVSSRPHDTMNVLMAVRDVLFPNCGGESCPTVLLCDKIYERH